MDQTKQPSDATTPAAAESPPKKTCGCHRRKSWLVATVITVLLAGAAYLWMDGNAQAATVVLGRKVPKNQRVEFDRMNHGPWDGLLKAYVNAQGEVNYAAWHRSPQAIAQLDAYLAHLSMAEPSLKASREATFAFWVNAYNAVTIKGILREYPTTSIKKHTPVIGYNIWKHLLLQVGDQQISLNDMEHKVLRKMGDPRIHFAIVCASISCPRLLNEAYQPKTLEEQLTRNTQQFFTVDRNFRIDLSSKTVYLSSILKWFASDFGANQAAQLRTLAPYLPTDAARQLAATPGVRVKYISYDWNLNKQPNR